MNIYKYENLLRKKLYKNLHNYDDGHGFNIFDKKDIIILISRLKKVETQLKFKKYIRCWKDKNKLNIIYSCKIPENNLSFLDNALSIINNFPSEYVYEIYSFNFRGGFKNKKLFLENYVSKLKKIKLDFKFKKFILIEILKQKRLIMLKHNILHFIYGYNPQEFLPDMIFE